MVSLTCLARYANCLLATLNARLVLRDGMDKHNAVAVWEYTASNGHSHAHSYPHSGRTSSSNHEYHNNNNGQKNVIHVHTQVETDIELGPYPLVSRDLVSPSASYDFDEALLG